MLSAWWFSGRDFVPVYVENAPKDSKYGCHKNKVSDVQHKLPLITVATSKHKKNACPKKMNTENELDSEVAGSSGLNGVAGPSVSKVNDGEKKDSVGRNLGETGKKGDHLEKNETQNNQDVSCEETVEKYCAEGVEETQVIFSQCEDETGVRNDHEGVGEVGDRDDEMEEMGDEDSLSEISDFTSQSGDDQLYTVNEINDFLDETFGKTFDVKSFLFFP